MGIMDACKNTNNKSKENRMNIETMSIVSIWLNVKTGVDNKKEFNYSNRN